MRIYLAAKFGEKQKMIEVATYLRSLGHVITSRWLDTVHAADADATEDELSLGAIENLVDINEADVVVTYSQPQGTAHTGGGRHFEFGYAYANSIPVVIVGPRGEHVFHYLRKHVYHASDMEGLLVQLREIEKKYLSDHSRTVGTAS